MPKVHANGIQIYYQQMGDGPDVVLIHGLTGDLSGWYLQAMPALAKEFRVMSYDLRGHGYSEMSPSGYDSAHMAADLHGLLVSLGIERAHLVGYSFGGTIGLHCAVLHPERVASLVLADPGIPVLQPLVDLKKWPYYDAVEEKLNERGLSLADERWADLALVARQMARRPFRVGLRRGLERNSRRLHRLVDNTSALAEAQEVAGLTMDRIGEVRQPTLAIYGEISPLIPIAEYLRDNMPNCRLAIVEEVAHLFALRKPEEFVAMVGAFLRGLNGDGASGAPRTP